MKCNHKWKIVEDILSVELSLFFNKKYYSQIYILQCQKCGELEIKKHPLGNDFNYNRIKGGDLKWEKKY